MVGSIKKGFLFQTSDYIEPDKRRKIEKNCEEKVENTLGKLLSISIHG